MLGSVTDRDPHETDDGALAQLLRVLDRLPFVSGLRRDIRTLRDVVYRRRPPRLMALGTLGSGRSRIANALLGSEVFGDGDGAEPYRWIGVHTDGAQLQWLEVPMPLDDAGLGRAESALSEAQPDCILLVCAPADVEDGMRDRLNQVPRLLRSIVRDGDAPLPLFAVLSQADRMPPAGTSAAPYPEPQRTAIDLARQRLDGALRASGLDVARTLAVACPASPSPTFGLEDLSREVFAALPEPALLEAARALPLAPGARRQVANRVVHACSTLALTVGLAPVPLSDALIIVPLQVLMVSAVAHVSGRPWDRKAAFEWMASVGVVGGAGMGLRWTAQQLAKLIPGAGTLVSAGVAGAGTATLGQSAIAYFLRNTEPRQIAETAGAND